MHCALFVMRNRIRNLTLAASGPTAGDLCCARADFPSERGDSRLHVEKNEVSKTNRNRVPTAGARAFVVRPGARTDGHESAALAPAVSRL